jgi:tRNA G37 N-methylase Trm5
VDRLKRLGYEPVREGEADAPYAELTPEGYYTTGDLLLMQTSQERAKEIQRRKEEEFLRRVRITEEMWEQSGSVEGVEKRMDRNSKTFFIANNPLAK